MKKIILIIFFTQLFTSILYAKPQDFKEFYLDLSASSSKKLKLIKKIDNKLLNNIVFDYKDGLSPDEASILAVLGNKSLISARDQLGIADAQIFQAGILPNPQLSYSADKPSHGNTDGTNTAYSFSIDWEVTSLIARHSKIRSEKIKKKSVKLDIAWQEWQIAQAARLSEYNILGLNEQSKYLESIVERLKENSELLQKELKKGEVTELEALAAQTSYLQAKQRQLELKKQIIDEKFNLKELIGLPAKSKLKLQNIILPSKIEPKTLKNNYSDIENKRLDLLALKQIIKSQNYSIHIAFQHKFPRINLGFTHAKDNGALYTKGISIGIDFPIFDHNNQQIELEKNTYLQLKDEYKNRLFMAKSNITRLKSSIIQTNGLIAHASMVLSPLDKLVKSYHKAVKEGQADILSYYNSLNNLTDKKIEIISLKMNLIQERIALDLSTGKYTPLTSNLKEQ